LTRHHLFFKIIYPVGIQILALAIRITSLFNPKAALWLKGRENWQKNLSDQMKSIDPSKFRLWIHCASLGEFEMALPVLEKLKAEKDQQISIIVTFFSPSGFEMKKSHPLPDLISYLPLDTTSNVQKFLEILQPNMCILVKYEFWLGFINALLIKRIPIYALGVRMTRAQKYLTTWKDLYLPFFRQFSGWFVQDEESSKLLKANGISRVFAFGDTRVDRALQIAGQRQDFPLVEEFLNNQTCLVLGSTWPSDDRILFKNSDWIVPLKILIAPHEIHKNRINQLKELFKEDCLIYSELNNELDLHRKKILIIDHIGSLAHIYKYATLAYIGGGFGSGLHNILEPLAHGIPVIFGPRIQKFPEAQAVVSAGIGKVIHSNSEWQEAVIDLSTKNLNIEIQSFLGISHNASEKISEVITQAIHSR
jgi:3-deoxy-D-manno-octulosonic-acid transferase